MRIFDYFFNRYGIPLLVVGSTGTGIKLYFGKVGYLTSGNSEVFISLEGIDEAQNLPIVDLNADQKLPAITPVVEPKKTTFADKIDSTKFKVFSDQTTEDVIRNVMFQRLYPNKDEEFFIVILNYLKEEFVLVLRLKFLIQKTININLKQ
ncbi:hypothetical protein [Candidatus Mycoplasma haematohominis]|uniref:Uncharacterized protein n=1 Tax=Candidatus Mycoplasma haematohominis TaxID=1494318 RepID=A0A478FU47_9MOLU|nr:hypothetical protein [Candidatus Mycoplasma haemohominis]GCE63876.1 hypothetical protein MHSWG343_08830 [Candidatus Mycoplasma haemohominis]